MRGVGPTSRQVPKLLTLARLLTNLNPLLHGGQCATFENVSPKLECDRQKVGMLKRIGSIPGCKGRVLQLPLNTLPYFD